MVDIFYPDLSGNGKGVVDLDVNATDLAFVLLDDEGGLGNGVHNNTDAFQRAAAKIQEAGGGTLAMRPGTYMVGAQIEAGAFGQNYAFLTETIFRLNGCTKPVVVMGNGAIIKTIDDLRYGAFNPETGNRYDPVMPFTDRDYVAYGVSHFEFIGCASVSISNLELDGNDIGYNLGGTWGDTGRQIEAYGLYIYNCLKVSVRDIHTHHHPADGMVIGGGPLVTKSSAKRPHRLDNVISEYNGRQNFSWTGGNSLLATECKFNFSGRSESGIQTSPGAGIDIEAEDGSICANGTFINCESKDNNGPALVANSGVSFNNKFIATTLVGTTDFSIWADKPGYKFEYCTIVGQAVNLYGSLLPDEATYFRKCLFTFDTSYSPTGVVKNATDYLVVADTVPGVVFDECAFDTAGTGKFPYCNSYYTIFRSCNFKQTNADVNSLVGSIEGFTHISTPTGLNNSARNYRGHVILNGAEYNTIIDAADDVAAAAAGVLIGQQYRTGSAAKVRVA